VIRHAALRDLAALVELERRCFDSDLISRRSFRRFLQNDSDYLLVAEIETGVAGYILLLKHRGTRLARLYSICVDETARGRGIAEALMRAGEDAVRQRGCAYLRLEVRRDNDPAIALYRSRGYREVGVRPRYYAEDGEDALVMDKDL
jgi:ribosomal-protein-alanine acetyltransferase